VKEIPGLERKKKKENIKYKHTHTHTHKEGQKKTVSQDLEISRNFSGIWNPQ
jgi:hypothetical protein